MPPLFAGVDSMRKARLQRAVSCSVERISVTLGGQIEQFEAELCRSLNNDRIQRGNVAADGEAPQVIKRYLEVRGYLTPPLPPTPAQITKRRRGGTPSDQALPGGTGVPDPTPPSHPRPGHQTSLRTERLPKSLSATWRYGGT